MAAAPPGSFPVEQGDGRVERLRRQRAASRLGAKRAKLQRERQADLEGGMAGALDALGTDTGSICTVGDILARVRGRVAS